MQRLLLFTLCLVDFLSIDSFKLFNSQEFSSDLPTDVDDLASVNEVVAAFGVAGSVESTSLAFGAEHESAFKANGSGVKRNLSSAFVEVDSDDETLA